MASQAVAEFVDHGIGGTIALMASNEHDDDVEPEVEDGEIEVEEFPIADEDDEDGVEETPDTDTDESEI